MSSTQFTRRLLILVNLLLVVLSQSTELEFCEVYASRIAQCIRTRSALSLRKCSLRINTEPGFTMVVGINKTSPDGELPIVKTDGSAVTKAIADYENHRVSNSVIVIPSESWGQTRKMLICYRSIRSSEETLWTTGASVEGCGDVRASALDTTIIGQYEGSTCAFTLRATAGCVVHVRNLQTVSVSTSSSAELGDSYRVFVVNGTTKMNSDQFWIFRPELKFDVKGMKSLIASYQEVCAVPKELEASRLLQCVTPKEAMKADRRPVHIRAKYSYPLHLRIHIPHGTKYEMTLKSDKGGEITTGRGSSVHQTSEYFTLIPKNTWNTFTDMQFCFRADNPLETDPLFIERCDDVKSSVIPTQVYHEFPEEGCNFRIHPVQGCQLYVKLNGLFGVVSDKRASLGMTISDGSGILEKHNDSVSDKKEHRVSGYAQVKIVGPRKTVVLRITHRSECLHK